MQTTAESLLTENIHYYRVAHAQELLHVGGGDRVALTTEETYQNMATRVAMEYNIPTTTLHSLVWSETRWDNDAVGKDGELGLVQILPSAWPDITREQMLDPEYALRFAARHISEGREFYWTSCSCQSTSRLKVPTLPKGDARDLPINSTSPSAGFVVKLRYGDTYHTAFIETVTKTEDGYTLDIFEGNYEPCRVTRRTIPVDEHVLGYWSPY